MELDVAVKIFFFLTLFKKIKLKAKPDVQIHVAIGHFARNIINVVTVCSSSTFEHVCWRNGLKNKKSGREKEKWKSYPITTNSASKMIVKIKWWWWSLKTCIKKIMNSGRTIKPYWVCKSGTQSWHTCIITYLIFFFPAIIQFISWPCKWIDLWSGTWKVCLSSFQFKIYFCH